MFKGSIQRIYIHTYLNLITTRSLWGFSNKTKLIIHKTMNNNVRKTTIYHT